MLAGASENAGNLVWTNSKARPAELLAGRALASAPVNATWRNGAARTTRTTTADRAHTAGRRMTRVAIRYQRPVAETSLVAGVRRCPFEVCAAIRPPNTVRSDGKTKRAKAPAARTTIAPAIPIE